MPKIARRVCFQERSASCCIEKKAKRSIRESGKRFHSPNQDLNRDPQLRRLMLYHWSYRVRRTIRSVQSHHLFTSPLLHNINMVRTVVPSFPLSQMRRFPFFFFNLICLSFFSLNLNFVRGRCTMATWRSRGSGYSQVGLGWGLCCEAEAKWWDGVTELIWTCAGPSSSSGRASAA